MKVSNMQPQELMLKSTLAIVKATRVLQTFVLHSRKNFKHCYIFLEMNIAIIFAFYVDLIGKDVLKNHLTTIEIFNYKHIYN